MGSNQKLVEYFVISGLNISSGLEPDQLSGYLFSLTNPYLDVDVDVVDVLAQAESLYASFSNGWV